MQQQLNNKGKKVAPNAIVSDKQIQKDMDKQIILAANISPKVESQQSVNRYADNEPDEQIDDNE